MKSAHDQVGDSAFQEFNKSHRLLLQARHGVMCNGQGKVMCSALNFDFSNCATLIILPVHDSRAMETLNHYFECKKQARLSTSAVLVCAQEFEAEVQDKLRAKNIAMDINSDSRTAKLAREKGVFVFVDHESCTSSSNFSVARLLWQARQGTKHSCPRPEAFAPKPPVAVPKFAK